MIYEYFCPWCNKETELQRPMKDRNKTVICPRCDNKMEIKITGGAAVIFKGTGWPGQDLKKRREDLDVKKQVRRAKHLKDSGQVAEHEVLPLGDPMLQTDKPFEGKRGRKKK